MGRLAQTSNKAQVTIMRLLSSTRMEICKVLIVLMLAASLMGLTTTPGGSGVGAPVAPGELVLV